MEFGTAVGGGADGLWARRKSEQKISNQAAPRRGFFIAALQKRNGSPRKQSTSGSHPLKTRDVATRPRLLLPVRSIINKDGRRRIASRHHGRRRDGAGSPVVFPAAAGLTRAAVSFGGGIIRRRERLVAHLSRAARVPGAAMVHAGHAGSERAALRACSQRIPHRAALLARQLRLPAQPGPGVDWPQTNQRSLRLLNQPVGTGARERAGESGTGAHCRAKARYRAGASLLP